MAKTIKLSQDNSNDVMFVNADYIMQFWRPQNINYPVVELANGKTLTVKEVPDDIRVMIG